MEVTPVKGHQIRRDSDRVSKNQSKTPPYHLVKSPSDTTIYTPGLRKISDQRNAENSIIDRISDFVENIRIGTKAASNSRPRREQSVTPTSSTVKSTEDRRRVEKRHRHSGGSIVVTSREIQGQSRSTER